MKSFAGDLMRLFKDWISTNNESEKTFMNDEEYGKLRAHQLKALNALEEIDRLFSANKIDYYLLAGSVLGSVRHKGFIPWDDDIDIGILWRDKERAYSLLKEMPAPFVFVDRSIEPSFPRMYGKVLENRRGMVDVFLLVKSSNKAFPRRYQWICRKLLFKLYKSKIGYINPNERRNIKEKIKVVLAKAAAAFFSREKIEKAVYRNESRFEKKDGDYYINLYSPYSMKKELIKSDWLFPKGYVSFEGKTFPTVNNPDAYLTHLYGDYMTPPKESDRVIAHEELF